eukprot:2065331-Pyramimonas_sp.AAC.1
MAPKRRVSANNVSSKRGRVGKDMAKLLAQEEKLEFQNQMAELQADLMKDPSKLKQVRTVMKVELPTDHQPANHLNPDLLGKVMEKLPLKYLKAWIEESSGYTKSQIQA